MYHRDAGTQVNKPSDSAAIELAREIVELGRAELMMEFPFLKYALFALEPKVLEGRSISTDGRCLFYDSSFVLSLYRLDENYALRIWLHPIMHCMFMHMFVGAGIDPGAWDLACDIAAEAVILDLISGNYPDPADEIRRHETDRIMELAGGLTPELIYHYIKYDDTGMPGEWERLFRLDDHSCWYERQANDLKGESDYARNVSASEYVSSDDGKSKSSRSPDTGRSVWKHIAELTESEIGSDSKEYGLSTASLVRVLRKLRFEKTDYRNFLRKFCRRTEVLKTSDEEFDYIYYSYGFRLYHDTPLIEPLEYSDRDRIRDLVIVIDTSGSVQGETVELFLQKTYNIVKQEDAFGGAFRLHIIQADAEVKEDAVITRQSEFDRYIEGLQLKGFGGTDFRPAVAYIEKLKSSGAFRDLRGVLYFTDGHGIYPSRCPSFITAFVFIDNDDSYYANVPDWAVRILLSRDELAAPAEL